MPEITGFRVDPHDDIKSREEHVALGTQDELGAEVQKPQFVRQHGRDRARRRIDMTDSRVAGIQNEKVTC